MLQLMKVISHGLGLDVFLFCQISLIFKRWFIEKIFLFCFSSFLSSTGAKSVGLYRKQTKGKTAAHSSQ